MTAHAELRSSPIELGRAEPAPETAARPEGGPQTDPPRRGRLALGLALGAAGGIWLTHGPPWFLTLFANLAHWVALGFLLLVPWAARRRQRLAEGFSLGLVAAVGLVLCVRWSPGPERLLASEEIAEPLRIITYNLGKDLAGGESLVASLEAADADLIALEELSFANADLVARAFAGSHPYQALYPAGIPGRGLLSRYPILEHDFVDLTQIRKHLVCHVDVDGREVTVIVLHLGLTIGVIGEHTAAWRDLEALVDRYQDGRTLVLCGDFNTTENSDVWRKLHARGLVDAFRHAAGGPGFTFPAGHRYRGIPVPMSVRIDYVWTTPDLVATQARIGLDGGSDHMPLECSLAWRSADRAPASR